MDGHRPPKAERAKYQQILEKAKPSVKVKPTVPGAGDVVKRHRRRGKRWRQGVPDFKAFVDTYVESDATARGELLAVRRAVREQQAKRQKIGTAHDHATSVVCGLPSRSLSPSDALVGGRGGGEAEDGGDGGGGDGGGGQQGEREEVAWSM